jgi:NADPH:quinone reductase-like Zn-dependent oxidoreductase
MTEPQIGREVRLRSRPEGQPSPDYFQFAEVFVPAGIKVMNPHGRMALCGALQRQSGTVDVGPGGLFPLLAKRLTLRGFTVGEHLDRAAVRRVRNIRDLLASGFTVADVQALLSYLDAGSAAIHRAAPRIS